MPGHHMSVANIQKMERLKTSGHLKVPARDCELAEQTTEPQSEPEYVSNQLLPAYWAAEPG